MLDSITIDELKQQPIWVCHKNKVPINPITGEYAKSNTPSTWASYLDAADGRVKYDCDGLGFCLQDNLFCIDIDAVNHGQDNWEENPLANELTDLFWNTYIEKSVSGTGYHIVGLCDIDRLPLVRGKDGKPVVTRDGKYLFNGVTSKNTEDGIEFYAAPTTSRYLTFTGNTFSDNAIVDVSDRVEYFLKEYMSNGANHPASQSTVSSVIMQSVIDKARRASNGKRFVELYDEGNISFYQYDDSSADLALCSMLAYWFGNDTEQMDKAFRRSALYREKWERDDYRTRTLEKACSGVFVPSSEYVSKLKTRLTLTELRGYLEERGIRIMRNEITREIEYDGIEESSFSETPFDMLCVSLLDSIRQRWTTTKQELVEKLGYIADTCHYNPVDAILKKAQPWDGVDRIPEIMKLLGIPAEDELSKTLLHKWLLQAMALAHNDIKNPFCSEGVLCLIGNQGKGKSLLVSKLGLNNPKLYKLGLEFKSFDRDAIMRNTQTWIGEFGEIGASMKRNQIDSFKNFVTLDIDKYRGLYHSSDTNAVRKTAYIATGNNPDFLIDETGSRRFFTIKCSGSIDKEELERFDAIQLWQQIASELNQYEYSTALTSPYQAMFRLTEDERRALLERNRKFQKALPAEQDISDIFAQAELFPGKYVYDWCTVSMFKDAHAPLHAYTAEQIGHVLSKMGIESKAGREHGSKNVGKLRKLPMPNNSGDTGNSPYDF